VLCPTFIYTTYVVLGHDGSLIIPIVHKSQHNIQVSKEHRSQSANKGERNNTKSKHEAIIPSTMVNTRARGCSASSPAAGHTTLDLPSVQAARVNTAETLGGVVHTVRIASRPKNTAVAYDPKIREYMSFCEHVYGTSPVSSRYTVGTEKVFHFLFYHAFREQYVRGGKARKQEHGFSGADYDRVTTQWATYQDRFERGEIDDIPDPDRPLQADAINTYKSTLYNQWLDQASNGANGLTWDLIYTRKCKELVNLVKERKRRMKRKIYAEKIDGEFTPFTSLNQVGNIENAFWDHGKTVRESIPSLRNRYIFLQCYSGLLRSESMFLGELSDMLGIEYQRSRDSDPFFILVMQIATGKWCVACCCVVCLFLLLNLMFDCCILAVRPSPQVRR
jgi:hypothetical protein